MNERIDVLAVMDRDRGDAHRYRCEQLRDKAVIRREQESVEARSAVAELIEALRKSDALIFGLTPLHLSESVAREIVAVRHANYAALARVQGGA